MSLSMCVWKQDGRTPLIHAAMEGRVEAMKILLEHRAVIDAVDDELRYTALHWAAHRGHAEAAKLLLENNCNLEKQSIVRFPLPSYHRSGRAYPCLLAPYSHSLGACVNPCFIELRDGGGSTRTRRCIVRRVGGM